jgi:hypothetical protein
MKAHHLVAVLAVSYLLGALRLAGARHEAFQAVAHLWVGGLIGARIAAGEKECGRIAFALSVLELVAFILGIGK